MSVTVGGLDFENTFFNSKKWNIKSTTSKIEDQNISLLSVLFIETISNGGSSRLINNSENVETRDGTSILSCLSLRVIEISRDCYDSWFNWLTKISFSNFLHFYENHGWNLFSLEFFGFTLVFNNDHWFVIRSCFDFEGPELDISLDCGVLKLSSNKSLGIEDCIKRVSSSLIFCGITNKTLVFGESYVRWGCVETLIICDDFNFVVYPDTDTRICGSEINTDGFVSHVCE